MKRDIYAVPLRAAGTVSMLSMMLLFSVLLCFLFPEADGWGMAWNILAPTIPLVFLKEMVERTRNKLLSVFLLFLSLLFSLIAARGNVAKCAWCVSLLVFGLPAALAPRPDGRLLMTRPRPWHFLPFILVYAMGEGSGNSAIRLSTLFLSLVFLLSFFSDMAMTRTLRRIRNTSGEKDVSSLVRANNRAMAAFVAIFLLLVLTLPLIASSFSSKGAAAPEERWEESVSAVAEERQEGFVPEERDILVSRNAAPFRLEGAGNALTLLFVLLMAGGVFLGLWAVVSRITGIRDYRENHAPLCSEFIVEEEILRKEDDGREEREGRFSPSRRIRRIYRRLVERKAGDGLRPSLSPGEIDSAFFFGKGRSVTEIYNRVRYSGDEATGTDVERMRKEAGKL